MSSYRLFASDPYVAILDSSDVNLGYVGPLEPATLVITLPDPDKVEVLSKKPASYGQAVASYSKPKPAEIEIAFNEMPVAILAWAMLGTTAAYSQASGTDQSLSFTSRHDKWVYVGKHNLSAFTISGKSAVTDFTIDLVNGLCKVLSTGTIADATTTSATASYPAKAGSTISAGTSTILNLGLKSYVTNLFDNSKGFLIIPKLSVTPSGAFDFAGDTPVEGRFKGTILKLTGQDLFSFTELTS